MDSNQRLRARIILGGIIIVACGLLLRLYSIQISQGSSYLAKANKQYERPGARLFDRGTIFMSGKDDTRPAAATLTSTYIISMTPKLILDGAGTYEALSHYMDIDKDDFMMKTTFAEDPYEEIARKVDEKTSQSIKALALPGIAVTKESKRSYPGGESAAHVIGILGEREDGSIEGKYGLERTYNDVLARSGTSAGGSIFAQLFGDAGALSSGSAGGEGDIVTTLEPVVQAYLETVLTKTSMTWKPDEIGGIIIDPSTGEIVAAAALPAFDPNDLSKISSAAVLSNPLIENVYEMGSIIKPLTVATGLDSGAITTSSTYDDTGTLTLSGKKISNFDGKARGVVNVQEILSQSLNVGAATVALKAGKDAFTDYFMSFGLGEKTGVDQPNESTGLLANLKSGRDIEIATAAYGQGIAMSPIATTRALSALANGGMLVTPHFVKEIDYVDGTKKMLDFGTGERVLKQQSSEDVTRMLVKVVDTALRNGTLKLEGYSVAAKTGTAQIPDPVSKKYFDDRYLHSFFGYFPAYDAKFLVFLYQKYPKGAQYASETLAEPFHDLTKFLIDYYNVPPDR
ncbi:MAG: penicillin-binding protein 2 [Candidatus Pacebacteria bacterium]|nr:penicillin-binding protein 2 [Candidatus Paceibacterota bacterium]